MSEYVIFTDSSCDLPIELVNTLGVKVLQLDVTVEGEEPCPNDKVDISEFYQKLRDGKNASTSAVSIAAFEDAFEPAFKENKDVLYLGFSSGLSSTFNWGKSAGEELVEKYPERKFYAVDTLAASLGEGLLVHYAARMQQNGSSMEEVRDFIEENKLNLCHWFTVSDLFFLKRGGRVNAATAVMGTMLSIKPVMHVDDEGHLVKVTTARGRKASIVALAERMESTAIKPEDQVVFISHGDCADEAEFLSNLIKEKMGVKEVLTAPVGPVIGAHSGPGTMALFFMGTKR